MQPVNRPLTILTLAMLATFGASNRVMAKVSVPENIASGVFAENYAGNASSDDAGSLGFAGRNDHPSYETASGRPKWVNRDPIGEWGSKNLYQFCLNNPLAYFDYLGWDPTPVNTGSYVPATNQPEADHFKDVSDASSDPGHSRETGTGQLMLDQLKDDSKKNCCVKTWTIAGHGWRSDPDANGNTRPRGSGIPGSQGGPNGAGLYNDDNYPGLDKNNGGASLDDLQSEISAGTIKFCSKCTIQLHSCYVSDTFISHLASVTGCSVVGAGGKCSGGGGKKPWKSGPTDHPKDDKPDKDNGFRKGEPGQSVQPVGPSYPPTRP